MANLKFYMTPGSCSTGIHLLLEELELFFEAHVIDLMAGDDVRSEYLAINPRGSVPTLVRSDGSALTDFISIARWLAETHPRRKLLPDSEEDRTRVLQLMEYAIGVVHGEGFTRSIARRVACAARCIRGANVLEIHEVFLSTGLDL